MIYFLYGVSGPIKPLFIAAVEKCFQNYTTNETADLFNRMGTTLSKNRGYDSDVELEMALTVQDMNKRKEYRREEDPKGFSYVQDMGTQQEIEFYINIEQLDKHVKQPDKHVNELSGTHFIICHDIPTIENIAKAYKDETHFTLLGVRFGGLQHVLDKMNNRAAHKCDVDSERNKINRLESNLRQDILTYTHNNLKYNDIWVTYEECRQLDYDGLVNRLCELLKPVIGRSQYHQWEKLLNTQRIFGPEQDVSNDTKYVFSFLLVSLFCPCFD